MAATAPRFSTRPIYEGTRIPHPIPTVLTTSDEVLATGDVMTVNFGPNHPSTHGVLRLIVDLYGEDVTGLAPAGCYKLLPPGRNAFPARLHIFPPLCPKR